MSNIVQSKTDSYALLALESGSVTLSFDNPTRAGNSVVFAIVYEQFGSSPESSGLNVTDSQGLAYERATSDIIQQVGVFFAGSFQFLYSGMACLFATGSHAAGEGVTFTFNPSVLGVCTVGIFEIAGTVQFDAGTSNFAIGNGLTSIATGTISPATGYFEVAACLECLSASITGVSSGWTLFGANVEVGVLAYASQEEGSATFAPDYPVEAVPLPAGAAIWAFTVTATYSISGNAGASGATVSYSGTASGSVVADGSGKLCHPGIAERQLRHHSIETRIHVLAYLAKRNCQRREHHWCQLHVGGGSSHGRRIFSQLCGPK